MGTLVLSAFIVMAVFGLYLPQHMGHEMGCQFAPHESALCSTPFMHLQHWQSAFTAVLGGFLILIAVILFVVWAKPLANRSPQYERLRLRHRTPKRPTLFQELFSRGILNRKEPPCLGQLLA